ncbi:hypothetical protein ES708_21505 [subsurface metagenome]
MFKNISKKTFIFSNVGYQNKREIYQNKRENTKINANAYKGDEEILEENW